MTVRILIGDVRSRLAEMPDESVHCVVTSPPYFGLRDYGTASWESGDPACDHSSVRRGHGDEKQATSAGTSRDRIVATDCKRCGAIRTDKQIGLEDTPSAFVAVMVEVFREVRRVLRADGTLWLNLGDSYAGSWGSQGHRITDSNEPSWHGSQIKNHPKRGKQTGTIRESGLKPKDLMGIPWRVAFALQDDGWYLRQDIIWSKPNPMPESVTDRCTKAHEYLFLLSKSARYYFDAKAIEEPANHPEGAGNKHAYRVESERPGENANLGGGLHKIGPRETRNKRSVWTVATQPFTDWNETVHRERVAPDAVVDGKKRITSPDCPLHGDRADPASIPSCDAHAGDRSSRNQRTGADLAQEPQADCAPIETNHEPATGQRSSDLPGLACDPSAIDRNSRSHRTDRDPATTLACTASAQIPGRTGDTSEAPAPSGSADRTLANSTGQGETDDHPSVQMTGRIARNSSSDLSLCTCEWYIEKTTKTSHFATFPPALIEPCILAGCPEGGTVLDPFAGAGTTGLVADRHCRDAVLIELNPAYAAIADRRIHADAGMFAKVAAE